MLMAEPPTFYESDGLHVELYDALTARGGSGVDGDAAFFVRHAQQFGDPVLELGAGTGRVSWALAEAGDEVVGLEISAAMLARARAKAEGRPASVQQLVRFVQGDMVSFELDVTFPLAIIPFRAFQCLLTPEAQRQCLRCIRRHLRAGGRLIVDLFDPRLERCVPDAGVTDAPRVVTHPGTGRAVHVEILRHESDPLRQVLTEVWRFREMNGHGGVVREAHETLRMRWTYRQEMRYLLELTGYEIEAECADYLGSPPAYGAEQVYVARRV